MLQFKTLTSKFGLKLLTNVSMSNLEQKIFKILYWRETWNMKNKFKILNLVCFLTKNLELENNVIKFEI